MVLRGAAHPEPRNFIFDGPFFVGFVHQKSEIPYAALWIADPEILVPRDPVAAKESGEK